MDEKQTHANALRALADRFSEGWHDGIKIDASDVMDLAAAADEIEALRKDAERYRWLFDGPALKAFKAACDNGTAHALLDARTQLLAHLLGFAVERDEVDTAIDAAMALHNAEVCGAGTASAALPGSA